jgi:hypothetical protein
MLASARSVLGANNKVDKGGGGHVLVRACTALRRQIVCRTSNCAYRHMYKQAVQPIDKEVVCKLFNDLHVDLD